MIVCCPIAREEILKEAVPAVLSTPVARVVEPSIKVTDPVGGAELFPLLTDTRKMTPFAANDGLALDVRVVAVRCNTSARRGFDVLVVWSASPR